MSDRDKKAGGENEKVSDTAIQGTKGGERNRALTDAGVMPPPAGEARGPGKDPRDVTRAMRKD
ncbi:MAG: hypothetical protein IPO30_19875 [Hyphomonadaceae bacterium]|nr:hypothetical protein [Hyphomonadaceae bacterium]